MRRNSSTVVVLAGQVPGEVLAAATRSLNVTLYRPQAPAGSEDGDDDRLAAAAVALQRAGRSTSPYALVPADPLAAVAARWQELWDLSKQPGPAAFELPDYYLVLAQEAEKAPEGDQAVQSPDFYLGPLRSVRPHRMVLVPATEPAQQAAGVLHALGSLRHGPWWPGLDQVIDTARRFYPASLGEQGLAEENVVLAQ